MLAAGIAVLVTLAHGSAGGDSDAPAATMVLMLAATLLGPALALPFVLLLGLPVATMSRGPGLLARANARANLRRTASVATPLMLAVSLVATIFFAKSALQHRITEQTDQRITAEHVVRPENAPGLLPAVATEIRTLPGVSSASGSIATSVVVAADGANPRSLPARGVDPVTLSGVLDLGVESGSLAALRGETLAAGASTARALGWQVGDRVQLLLGDGTPASLRVVATYSRALGFADVTLPRSLVERHVDRPLDDAVFVKGTGPGLRAGLEALAKAEPSARVLTRAQYREELEADAAEQSLAVYVLLGVLGVFCAMALVNAITMSTAERAREFALLRLVGASKRQVRTMVRAETRRVRKLVRALPPRRSG
jgi:putative ABC transport system permease protein